MTKTQAESLYNQQLAEAQARVDAAYKAQQDYLNSISDYGYSKQVKSSPNSKNSDRSGSTKTVYYGGLSSTDNNATHVLIGDKWKANQSTSYAQALANAQNALSNIKMNDYDKDSNYTSNSRVGSTNPGLSANLDYNTAEADRSLRSGQMSSQGTASANQSSNINAGIDRSKAGLLGANNSISQGVDTTNNIYKANNETYFGTQADYLNKMSQANALDIQASNIRSGVGAATLSAGLQGAASGAMTGAALAMTSDENQKESPNNNPDDLNDLIKQFRTLYRRLQGLKKSQEVKKCQSQ